MLHLIPSKNSVFLPKMAKYKSPFSLIHVSFLRQFLIFNLYRYFILNSLPFYLKLKIIF